MSIPLLLISLSCGAISTGFLIPFVRTIALRLNLVDRPNKRKQHQKKIVRLGGIAIFLGFTFSLLITALFGGFQEVNIEFIRLILIIYSASLMFFTLGLADDIFSLSPFLRLIIQFMVSIILWLNNIKIDHIDLTWGADFSTSFELPIFLSLLLTIIWITGITNAINWIDGLDGLAAGNIAISCIGIFFVGINLNNSTILFLASSLMGVCIGFLRFNYNPASILMGDCGSYFLGSTISVLTLIACSNFQLNSSDVIITKLHYSVFLLLVPILDMVYVIFKRIISGKSPFRPDRGHIHHKMLDAGFKTRQTVELIYSFTFIACIFPILGIFNKG